MTRETITWDSHPARTGRTLHAVTHHLRRAAEIVAGWPSVVTALAERHVAGPDGRCRGCPSHSSPAPQWPCRLADLAHLAARAQARRG